MKVVFTRSGQRTVITGWRAWAMVVPLMLIAALILVQAYRGIRLDGSRVVRRTDDEPGSSPS